MSIFARAQEWKLLNQFTIEQPKEPDSDRALLLTRVPQRINAELIDLRILASACWTDRSHSLLNDEVAELEPADGSELNDEQLDPSSPNSPSSRPRHTINHTIYGKANIEKDTITVFSMEKGAEFNFKKIERVSIKSISPGSVGGKYTESQIRGIVHSGFSARKVPDGGFMIGEPGVLFLMEPMEGWADIEEPFLQIELYLEEEAFSSLFSAITQNPHLMKQAGISFLADLFQNEVEAALSEPWHRHDYGLIRFTDYSQDLIKMASTRARLETINIWIGDSSLMQPDNESHDDDLDAEYPSEFERRTGFLANKIGNLKQNIASNNF